MSKEIKINARNLSNPGPRLLVENALSSGPCDRLKVVVSSAEAAADVKRFLEGRGADVEIDKVADDYLVVATFGI